MSIRSALDKELRRSGMVLAEPEVLRAMEHSALEGPLDCQLHVRPELRRSHRADQFHLSVLRPHLLDFGGERGLTADFRVLDENEASLMRRRVLPRVLEEFWAGPPEAPPAPGRCARAAPRPPPWCR